MKINRELYPVLNKDYVLVKQYGDSILYPLVSDNSQIFASPEHQYLKINRTAAEILSLCNGYHSISGIIDELSSIYTVESKEDIYDLISDFLSLSLNKGHIRLQMHEEKQNIKVYGDFSMVTPVFACLEVTKRCPLRCRHCYNNSGIGFGYEMNLDEIKKVLDILSSIGVQKLMITGGEATVRNDFLDIIEYASSKFVALSIASNGYLIDQNMVEKLSLYRHKIVVQISVDGTEEHHNNIRGKKDSYSKAIQAIRLLRKYGVPVIVATTLNHENFSDMESVAAAVYEAGALQITYAITTDQGRARKNHLSYKIDLNEFISRSIAIKKEYLSKGLYVLIEEDTLARIEESTTQNCKAGISQIAVRENGDVAPCLCFFYTYGNLLTDDLRTIFSPERNEKFKRLPLPNSEYCHSCDELDNCIQCPARAYDSSKRDCHWREDFYRIMEN